MIDQYTYPIVALLPLSALVLVLQKNPYQALVVRAIIGAVAALVYVILGGADVALTEALVGTMLAVTLYIIAVRSSLVMRLGIAVESGQSEGYLIEIFNPLQHIIGKYHLRLELTNYSNHHELETALLNKEIHATCTRSENLATGSKTYHTNVRVHRLFEIMEADIATLDTTLNYLPVPTLAKGKK